MPNTVLPTNTPSSSGSVEPSLVSEGGGIVGALIGVVVMIFLVVWFLLSKSRKRHQ